jgi:hypothetical protein
LLQDPGSASLWEMAESEIVTSLPKTRAKVYTAQLICNGQLGDFGFGGRQPSFLPSWPSWPLFPEAAAG